MTLSPLTTFVSVWYWLATVADCLSTNWNRDSRASRGLDPNLAEKHPITRAIMVALQYGSKNYWTVVRMVGGVSLWGWMVLERGATWWSDPIPGWQADLVVVALDLVVTVVVYYNSRSRFKLPWL